MVRFRCLLAVTAIFGVPSLADASQYGSFGSDCARSTRGSDRGLLLPYIMAEENGYITDAEQRQRAEENLRQHREQQKQQQQNSDSSVDRSSSTVDQSSSTIITRPLTPNLDNQSGNR